MAMSSPTKNGTPKVRVEIGEAVRAHRHEAGLAEVQQARVAEVDGEARGQPWRRPPWWG